MIDWVMKLLGICEHKWDIYQEVTVYDADLSERPIGTKFVMRCQKCGNFKTYKTY